MSRETILIVDDNAANLKLAKVVLSSAGYDVHTATDAEEALQFLVQVSPALVLMDIQLPGMDGLELTRVLKRDPAHARTQIIALTAYAMLGDEDQARKAGCDGYITKPIDTRQLAATIESFIVASRTRAGAAT